MKIQIELLKRKDINPLQKLILGLILNESTVVLQIAGGYDKTCTEIGKELGVSRARILKEFDELIQLDLITSEWGFGRRLTNVTQRLKESLTGAYITSKEA
jgi:biotin operon repressor